MSWEQITKENLVEEHKKLTQAIYDYDYHVATFERARDTFEINFSNHEHVCSFWNHFWYMLPNNPAIQREPFNRICDMAEGAYLYEID